MADGGSKTTDPWTSLPLPPGWEAKYDVAQKRYFFVDHMKKVTTWEDPRMKIWQQQKGQLSVNRAPSPSHHDSAASPSRHQRDASPSQRSSRTPAHQASAGTPYGQQSRGSTPSRDQTRGTTPSRQTANSKGQTSQQKESTISLRSVVAQQEKNRMRDKLHAEFPSCSLPVIDLALESCSFEELKTRILLTTLASTTSTTTAHRSATTSTVAGTSVTVTSPVDTAATSTVRASSPTPVVNTTSTFELLKPKTFTSSVATTASSTDPKKKTASVAGATTSTSSSSSAATRKSGTKVLQSVGARNAANNLGMTSSDMIRGNDNDSGVSAHQSLAKGPDASLANGPNKHLLLTNYVDETGPCAEFHVGPDRSNRNGPSDSYHTGPNPGLVSGPKGAIRCGSYV